MATTSMQERRAFKGPAVLSFGFRPFFLAGAAWGALSVALWLPVLTGTLALPTLFSPVDWHIHELLFGFLPAVVAGFLLTAVPNWTGRLPVCGTPLAALVGLWFAGRVAVACSAYWGAASAGLVDVSFLLVFAAVVARELVAGRNTRNLKVLALVALLALANACFHLEAARGGAEYSKRLGLAVALMLIVVIGGRVIPSFTRNWLAARRAKVLPKPFDRFDVAVIVLTVAALLAWVAAPAGRLTGFMAAAAALAHLVRLARWAGWQTTAEPLVTILHAGYAFVPLGFLLAALDVFAPGLSGPAAATHAWTTGAVGTMTLAIMTRASLGHTGQPLRADWPVRIIYLAILAAAVTRVAAAFGIWRDPLLAASATLWVAAFGTFVTAFAPSLSRPRAGRGVAEAH